MKFKKAFAVILAVAMVITLMPTMAFASTTNTVSQVFNVAADEDMPVVKLNLKATGKDNVGGIFDLTLENAEWAVDGEPDANKIIDTNNVAGTIKRTEGEAIQVVVNNVVAANAKTVAVDKTSIRIDTDVSTTAENQYIEVYLALKSGTEPGEVTVSVTDVNAKVSNQTLTVAKVADSKTVTSVVGSTIKKVSSDGTYEGNQIKISETSVNAVKDGTGEYQAIRLALPKDYEWDPANTKIGGDLANTTVGGSTIVLYDATVHLPIFQAGTAKSVCYSLNENKNILTLYFNAVNAPYEQILTITPSFTVGSEAKEGEVAVNISNLKGDISDASDLVIAENVVESVEVKTFSEITTVQSGLKLKNNSADPYYVYVQLKENVTDALTAGKTVEFDFPEEIQVLATPRYSKVAGASKTSSYTETAGVSVNDTTAKDASGFKWTAQATAAKDTITFKVPVSVEAGFTGDFDVTVKGAKAGIDEQSVTVGTAVNPVTIEAAVNDVKTGIQNQAVSSITIKETAKGILQDSSNNDTVTLSIKGYANSGITLNKAKIKAEVTEGDIEISEPTVNNGVITFTVKSASSKPSTIVISGFTVTMNRVAAEGGYDLRAAGNAIVDNETYNDGDFQPFSVASANYLNVITPADSDIIDNKIDAKFAVGESKYTNNGTEVAMDAASFIANNRTYVPVRYLANALGVTDENIAWNEAARTVTLTGSNTVVKLTVGSNIITTSTDTIKADVPVIVRDNRTYLPARFVANAFGADVAWDAVTRTVTITK